jgi:hypothetical protein
VNQQLDQRLCWPYISDSMYTAQTISAWILILLGSFLMASTICLCVMLSFLSTPQVGAETGVRPIDTLFLVAVCATCVGLIGFLPIVLGVSTLRSIQKIKNTLIAQRQATLNVTHSILMSKAEYVGGHPLIPNAGTVVLGLSENQLTIYSLSGRPTRPPAPLYLLLNERMEKWLQHYTIQSITAIPLLDVTQVGSGRPKTAREIYYDDSGYTIDVSEHAPFLFVTFKLNGESYRVSFESFESETPPQKWCNQIIALKYKLQSGGGKTN